jgi:hypothetical protein
MIPTKTWWNRIGIFLRLLYKNWAFCTVLCYVTAQLKIIMIKHNKDAFHLRSDMTFPHVDQSSLFFNMFILLHIGQKLHTQFLKFSPPPFFMALQVFKEKSKKMNMITRKDD